MPAWSPSGANSIPRAAKCRSIRGRCRLVSLTTADFVGPAGALVIGFVAGIACFWATQTIKRKLTIDDSLDVFPVHGVGGILGTLLTAVFAASSLGGLGLPEGVSVGEQFVRQRPKA